MTDRRGLHFPGLTCLRAALLRALGVLLWLLVTARAGAEPGDSCGAENLLVQARVVDGALSPSSAKLLTDRRVAREGAPWPDESLFVVLSEPVTFDLGAVVALRQLYLQVDADQAFGLDLSENGESWTRLPVDASSTVSGVVSRNFNLGAAQARFVKLVPTSEPSTLTVTELGVFCQRQAKLRRGLMTVEAPRPPPTSSWIPRLLTALTGMPVISPTGTNVLKLVVVALCLALWGLEHRLRRRYGAGWMMLGALAIAAYVNVGSYRYPDFVHDHDVYHYFLGAKYFPELGYEKMYACSAVAEAEAGFEQRVRLRAQRDLRDNRLISGAAVLASAADCRARFGPERWQTFRRDVAYFADGRSVEDWHRVLKDHGFNASPTWIALARALGAQLPASEVTIGHRNAAFAGVIGSLDPLLLLLALAAIFWAFGLRSAALVAVVFSCNPLSEFAWVGGGFLREAWLSTLAIGLALLKKQLPFAAGVCLALSALLQLFPVVSLLVPVLAVAAGALPRSVGLASFRSLVPVGRAGLKALGTERELRRLCAGAALTLLVLAPLSALATGSERAWSAFTANTAKHEATPSGNLVGLGTLLSFRPSTNVDALFDENAEDPFARARAARLATRRSMRPLQGLIVIAALGTLALGLRQRRGLWWSAALGLCLVPLMLETSCYYAAWLCAFALVGHERKRFALPVLATVLALLVAKLSVSQLGVDMALASAIVLAGVGSVLLLAVRPEPVTGDAD